MAAPVRLYSLPPASGGGPVVSFHKGLEALSRAHSVECIGSQDFVTSAQEFAAYATDADRRVLRVLAVADGEGRTVGDLWRSMPARVGPRAPVDEGDPAWDPALVAPVVAVADQGAGPGADAVVGSLSVVAPLGENTDCATVSVQLSAPWRHQGLDALLLRLGEAVTRSWGRTTAQYWTDCPGWVEVGSPLGVKGVSKPVPGVSGAHASPLGTPETDMLARAGYVPAHSEWVTTLDVDRTPSREADPVPGYEVVSWSSPRSPEHLLDQLAEIYALASTDMPSGGLTEEAQLWDAGRVMRKEALAERSHQEWVVTAVRPVGGELVGWTTLVLSPTVAEIAFQEGTLIRGDHRRRGLARWIKRVNLAQLRARHPQVRRIHTWTDGDNAPVIALNRGIGFRHSLMEVGWQKDLHAHQRSGEGPDE
ncbi:MAG: GNAT family N-acetyltransferase [Actinomyces sp.]|nr:GNAT family N-acetyltransferase [Actinomyces sp.]MDN6428447.1 GNAT family N-acetyltransferase [Propionibacterium sp.]MDN6566028.1 GNAT family N-acetyltransferase [Actinomyces sp.]MDN6794144.1 GNAT family N-acetyltransferase [Propionibacterium sp.]